VASLATILKSVVMGSMMKRVSNSVTGFMLMVEEEVLALSVGAFVEVLGVVVALLKREEELDTGDALGMA
jgi:hypothetical protein